MMVNNISYDLLHNHRFVHVGLQVSLHADKLTENSFFFEQSEVQSEAQATKSILSYQRVRGWLTAKCHNSPMEKKCDAQTREDVLLNGVVQGEGL